MPKICKKNPKMCHQDLFSSKEAISWIFKSLSFTRQSYKKMKWKSCLHKCIMLKYKIMFQIFFVSKYFWVLEAVIFGTLLPEHPVWDRWDLKVLFRHLRGIYQEFPIKSRSNWKAQTCDQLPQAKVILCPVSCCIDV